MKNTLLEDSKLTSIISTFEKKLVSDYGWRREISSAHTKKEIKLEYYVKFGKLKYEIGHYKFILFDFLSLNNFYFSSLSSFKFMFFYLQSLSRVIVTKFVNNDIIVHHVSKKCHHQCPIIKKSHSIDATSTVIVVSRLQ